MRSLIFFLSIFILFFVGFCYKRDIFSKIGSTIIITCPIYVLSNNAVNVNYLWLKEDSEAPVLLFIEEFRYGPNLNFSAQLNRNTNYTLQIENAHFTDSGVYYCVAGILSNLNATFNLSKAKKVFNVFVESNTSEIIYADTYSQIELSCPFVSSPRNSSILYLWLKKTAGFPITISVGLNNVSEDDDYFPSINSRDRKYILQIRNSQREHGGIYECMAHCSAFTSADRFMKLNEIQVHIGSKLLEQSKN